MHTKKRQITRSATSPTRRELDIDFITSLTLTDTEAYDLPRGLGDGLTPKKIARTDLSRTDRASAADRDKVPVAGGKR